MNIITYICIKLVVLLLNLISAVFYWIPFIFRHKVLKFMIERIQEDKVNRIFVMKQGYKKWKLYLHPYFWMFCFTTGLTDEYAGPYWYKRDIKIKWFGSISIDYPHIRLKNKFRYFYICYCWQGLRNSCWSFSEWFFREGKWIEGSQKVIYCKSPKPIPWWDIMPEAKWDEGNDSGKQLRWPTEGIPEWMSTHEGKKLLKFITYHGNKRFYFGYCKVHNWEKRYLVVQYLFGWNWWNGLPVLHFKHILKKR